MLQSPSAAPTMKVAVFDAAKERFVQAEAGAWDPWSKNASIHLQGPLASNCSLEHIFIPASVVQADAVAAWEAAHNSSEKAASLSDMLAKSRQYEIKLEKDNAILTKRLKAAVAAMKVSDEREMKATKLEEGHAILIRRLNEAVAEKKAAEARVASRTEEMDRLRQKLAAKELRLATTHESLLLATSREKLLKARSALFEDVPSKGKVYQFLQVKGAFEVIGPGYLSAEKDTELVAVYVEDDYYYGFVLNNPSQKGWFPRLCVEPLHKAKESENVEQ